MEQVALASSVETFFNDLIATLQSVPLNDIPGVGDVGGVMDAITLQLQSTRDTLVGAINAVDLSVFDPTDHVARAAALRDALNAAGPGFLTASTDPGSDVVDIVLGDTVTGNLIDAAGSASLGLPALGIDVASSVDLDAEVAVNVALAFDVSDASDDPLSGLSFVNSASPELTLGLIGDFDFAATGTLGVLSVDVETDPLVNNELELEFAIDLDAGLIGQAGGGQALTSTVSGGLNAGLIVETDDSIAFGILPAIRAELSAGLNIDPVDILGGALPTPTPSFALDGVSVRSEALAQLFDGVLGQLLDIVDVFPLKQLRDIFNTRIPVVADFQDKITTFLDLAKAWSGGNAALDFLVTIVEIANFIDFVGDLGSEQGIELGDLTLDGVALGDLLDGQSVDFNTLFDQVTPPSGGSALQQLIALDPGGDPDASFGEIIGLPGLELPFLTQGPEILAQILLNGVSVAEEGISLITFDVPNLEFSVDKEIAFRVFGPLVVTIGGGFSAAANIEVGYSTRGIFAEDPNFFDGFFLGADPEAGGGFEPIAMTSLTLAAGAALDAVIARAGVEGGVTGTLEINLAGQDTQGRSHIGDLNFPCLFDDISGAIEAFVRAFIRVGFGPFSVERSATLADAVLAQFTFEPCEGPHGSASPDIEVDTAGLAAEVAPGSDTWRLNVGSFASDRELSEDIDRDVDAQGNVTATPAVREVFRIGFPALQEGEVFRPGYAVEAFGITQIIGEAAGESVSTITADAGAADDVIIADDSVDLSFLLNGGEGNDLLSVGLLASTMYGGAGNDDLSGSEEADVIYGGDDNDILDGGAGADSLFGGDGQDQVSYANSSVGVTFTPIDIDGQPGFQGVGGDADGDVLSSIEVLIGSDLDDRFTGNQNAANIIEGGRGDDTIDGGLQDDLLIGGRGGDTIRGGAGSDQTSYIFSLGGVFVDLNSGLAFGGEATGDVLDSIESVQGTFYSDVLVTSGNGGALQASNGDDELRSMGGSVSLFGGLGDDIVYADGDAFGDVLDGGGFYNVRPGRDLLSYRFSNNPVEVDLSAGMATALNIPFASSDSIVGTEIVDAAPGEFGEVIGAASGYSSFEDLQGSTGDDSLTGDDRGNSIDGLSGNDVIYGGGGADTIDGGSGADALFGGAGQDWADYRNSFGAVTVSLIAGTGLGGSAQGDTLDADIENLFGSSFNDNLRGNLDNNRINPGVALFGTDTVDGFGGDKDVLELRYGDLTTGITLSRVADFGSVSGGTALTFSSIDEIDLDATSSNDAVTSEAFANDVYYLRGGDDSIDDGGGEDIILAGSGDDDVTHSGRSTGTATALAPLWLDGGEDIDTLNIDLSLATDSVTLAMSSPFAENTSQADYIDGVVAITRFEIIENVTTGDGRFDDTLIQPGQIDNVFITNDGDDLIAPGLGSDTVLAGERPDGIRDTDVDLLILDYSDAVADHVESFFAIDLDETFASYQAFDEAGQQTSDSIFFQNVERIFATGTNGSDLMFGASDPLYLGPGDLLVGLAGGDTLYGGDSGDTLIAGVAGGDDIIDIVYGGAGADLFVLGDETGYFYGETSVNPPDNRDGVFIQDFSIAEGDTLQLVGEASDYAVTEFFGSTLLLRGSLGDPFVDAIFTDVTGFDLEAAYVTYVQEAPVAAGSFASSELTDVASVEETLERLEILLADAGLALPSSTELVEGAMPDPIELARQVRDGTLSGPALFDGFRASSANPVPEAQPAALSDEPLSVVTTGSEADVLRDIIRQQILAVPGELLTEPDIQISRFGDPTGFGLLREGFGLEGGIVLSTGIAEAVAGPNLADGSSRTFEFNEQLVDLEAVGVIGNSQIFRADVTGLDITRFTLSDANVLQGGFGRVTGSDIDTVFFSNELFAGNDSGTFSSLSKLDVLNFTPAGSVLEPGAIRLGAGAGDELVGIQSGFLNNPIATLDVRDGTGAATTNSFSMGDGGEATFLLDQPISGSDTPTYFYVAETGAFEGLFLQVATDPADQDTSAAGDLSTDFGLPGVQGDHLGFEVDVSFPLDAPTGTIVEVELFQIVVAFESLLELAGPDLQDRFRVTVNGFDALVLRDGSAAMLENLALSPFGDFHPDLIQNPVGDGPMADSLRADAFTAVLTVRAPMIVGEINSIRIEVEDRGDGLLDTAMFLAAPQIEDTLADTVALFDDPVDVSPVAVFDTVERALAEATSGNLVRVGSTASVALSDIGVQSVAADDLVIEAASPLAGSLVLDAGVTSITLLGTSDLALTGNSLNNVLIGNEGESTLIGGGGSDQLYGGDGIDTADYSGSAAGVTVLLSGAPGTGGEAQGDRLYGVENIVGSAFQDTLIGDGLGNTIDGLGAADSIVGSADIDVLYGNMGGDRVRGNDGDDVLYGGDGRDDLIGDGEEDFIFGGADADRIFGGGDNDTIEGGTGDDDLFGTLGADLIYGGDGEDLIAGNTGADMLYGGNGDDTVNGNEFADQLYGGAQDDLLNGGSGLDVLFGGGGEDVLNGGASSDHLTGGGGADTFQFTVTGGIDRITDWQDGIDMLNFTSDGLGFGDFAVSTFGGGAGTKIVGGGYVVFFEGVPTADIDAADFL